MSDVVSTTNLLGSVSLTPTVWDFVFLAILILAGFFYGLTLGKNRIMIINLGAFFGFILVNAIPWNTFSWLSENKPSSSVIIFLFFVLIVAFFFLLPKSSLTSAMRIKKRGIASWWQLWLLGLAQVGMLAAMLGSFLDQKILASLDPLVQEYIFSELGLFLWVFLNILFILVFKKKKEV